MLAGGEAALAKLDASSAIESFDRAALILHAADTEIALVRAYMQNGEYRRALAFGAHTAGAHLDVVGGSALYVWLLHLGGQHAIAARLLTQTEARMPGDPMLAQVKSQLADGAPMADGSLLKLPTRLAPYGSMTGLPRNSRVAGSGLLLPGGSHALVPLATLSRNGKVWLRSATGELTRARVESRFPREGLALLSLARPLPAPGNLAFASRAAFPGSAAFAVEHVAAPDARPGWPVLRSGFLGGLRAGDERALGIEMPDGPRGGPVFDGSGKLVGVAMRSADASANTLLSTSTLLALLPANFKAESPRDTNLQDATPATGALRASVDQIYENSLKICLQVITSP